MPPWIDKLVIYPEEEKHLSVEFSKYLIQHDGLFKQVLCDSGLFNEITKELADDKIDSFYQFLHQAYKDKPKDFSIPFPIIPWVYVPKLKAFQFPGTVYCPESFMILLLMIILQSRKLLRVAQMLYCRLSMQFFIFYCFRLELNANLFLH
ncbi:MAG: hypothetical protein IPH20_14485 [Bacteroidales bacterium]|nr:hypothetical protein [Bacteroidales bacterium]